MKKKIHILVVDDDRVSRELLYEILNKEGYKVKRAESGSEALKLIQTEIFDLVITDLKMDEVDGIDVLKEAIETDPAPEVIVVTGYSSVETAVETIKLGAYDYISKPLETKRIVITVEKALEKQKLKREVRTLRNHIKEKYNIQDIIYISKKMEDSLKVMDLVTETDSNVILFGESGTGKELLAQSIHYSGSRAGNPFIAINCAALPESLLESELFGHVTGAFTGATKEKKGLFEEADGGTLLLDEVGDMPQAIQIKLLRVLEDKKVRKLGSISNKEVDVRIISATNRDLEEMIRDGEFRKDLYYRLKVVPIRLPALRERKEDIKPLMDHFLKIYREKMRKDIIGFTEEVVHIFMNYNWPGNIRELENIIEGSVILCRSSLIGRSEISMVMNLDSNSKSVQLNDNSDLNLKIMYENLENTYILKALEKYNGNQLRAAKELGIARSTLWRKMESINFESNKNSH